MVITCEGPDSFKISQGDLSVAVNPVSKAGADLTLLSTHIADQNVAKESFVVSGPGEYEVKDVSVKGFLSEGPSQGSGSSTRLNTIYMVNFEGLNLCFLGSLANAVLAPETLEHLEDIDILFMPVGTLDVSASYKLAVSLEPSIIVPTSYNADSLKKFLKEAGEEGENLDKLVVKKKDLEGREGDIVVLKTS